MVRRVQTSSMKAWRRVVLVVWRTKTQECIAHAEAGEEGEEGSDKVAHGSGSVATDFRNFLAGAVYVPVKDLYVG
jgi:hypothetical protein